MRIPSISTGSTGLIAVVDARTAGWDLLNMEVHRLDAAQRWSGSTTSNEYVLVILGGRCHIRTSRGHHENIGQRENVFAGRPYALYLSQHSDFEVEALTDGFEIAACWVPTDQHFPDRLITPHDVSIDLRGGGNASRQVNGVIPPGFPCHRLVCVEAYIPGGNWAGYPPHKHDEHRTAPDGTLLEADLEEIYFYKFSSPDGFAYQRIYTASGSSDTVHLAQQNDTVLIHEGYHPTVGAPGCTTYLLNFLAGSAQSLANSDDPRYTGFKQNWGALDPRLPLIS